MEWFESWFDTPYYHLLYNNRDFVEAENFIIALTKELQLPKKSSIIDLACGKGRHSVHLNQLGFNILGLDLSSQSIDHNQKWITEGLAFRVHDMRNAIESEPVDAVFNLFTSFGYFENQKEDQSVFRSVSDVLKPGGYFVLDYLNERFVKNTLLAESIEKRDETIFYISKKIENQYIIKDIRFEWEGSPKHYFEKVKLHTLDTINTYAKENGFERIKLWGDYQLGAFELEHSPRCIHLFKKIE